MVEAPHRKRFTVAEVERMLELGFFIDDRYELIDGDLLNKRGQSPQHAFTLQRTWVMLSKLYSVEQAWNQMPIQAAGADAEHSLPEPNLAVVRENKPDYSRRHPRGNETVLVIEISDTTVAFDRTRKARLYAHSGVPEYWVLDLNRRVLIAHREPGDTEYGHIQTYSAQGLRLLPGSSGKRHGLRPPAARLITLKPRLLRHNRFMMTAHPRITIEPDKRDGKPCIRGMRITVNDVLGWLSHGMTEEEILEEHPGLEKADFAAIYAFAAEMADVAYGHR